MKALRLYGKQDIRVVDIPIPEINDNEILLKVKAGAICGTDVRMWQNGNDGVDEEHPRTMGHEITGIIHKVGKNVKCYSEGMKIGFNPNIGCGVCDMCVSGRHHLCKDYLNFGIRMQGGFAEYAVMPEPFIQQGNIVEIPEGVSFAEATLNEPLSCAYNGFLKCNVQPGEYAMVVGAGPIGLFHALLLKMAGAGKVIMNDISDERLETAKQIVDGIITYNGPDLPGFVDKETHGRGLDIAITANPVPAVQAAMLPLMNFGGRVNFFGGIPASKQPVPIDTNIVHYRELILTGATRSSAAQFRKTLEFVADGLVPVGKMVTGEYKIEDALQAFENAKAAKGIKQVIVFD